MQPIGGKHRLHTQKVAAIVEKDIWHLIPFWNINQQLSWKQVDVGWFCEPVLKIEKTLKMTDLVCQFFKNFVRERASVCTSDSTVSDRGTSTTGGHSREKKLNSRGIVEPAQSHQYTVSLLVVDCGLFLAYLVSAKALIRWTGLCCIAAIH
jgi:hypothetical protein